MLSESAELPHLVRMEIDEFEPRFIEFAPSLKYLDCIFHFPEVDFSGPLDDDDVIAAPSFVELNLRSPYSYDDGDPLAFDWLTLNSHTTLTSLSLFFDDEFQPSLSPFLALTSLKVEIAHTSYDLWKSQHTFKHLPPSLDAFDLVDYTGGQNRCSQTLPDSFLSHLPLCLTELAVHHSTFAASLLVAFAQQSPKVAAGLKKLRFKGSEIREGSEGRWSRNDELELIKACELNGVEVVRQLRNW